MSNFTFISYRRDGAEAMAQLVYDRLMARGITVFYDIESLKSGTFNDKIYDEIDKCDNFVLILPKNGLERCQSDDDWVRKEIRYALEKKKNIIPMMMRGFVFPDNLPDDIKAVKLYQGINIDNMDFLDAKIDKLIGMMTRSSEGQEIAKVADKSADQVVVHHSVMSGTSPHSHIASALTASTEKDDNIPPLYLYSTHVFLNRMSAIWFKIRLKDEVAKGESALTMKIYNASGVLIAQKSFNVNIAPDTHELSVKWDGKKYDGGVIDEGVYSAVFDLNESGAYVLNFTALNVVNPREKASLFKRIIKRIFPSG